MRNAWVFVSVVVLLAGVGPAQGAVPLAGYWDTRLEAASGGRLTLWALCTDAPDALEIGLGGSGLGIYLDEQVAGSGIYTFSTSFGPAAAGRFPLFLLTHRGAAVESGWPYLVVREAPTATPQPTNTPQPTPTATSEPAYCHPLSLNQCVLPFPSNYYLEADATSVTGRRVHLPQDAVPNQNDPHRINIHDGFSPSSSLLAEFHGIIDGRFFNGFEDLNAALAADSKILVIDADLNSPYLGKRYPMHIELITAGFSGNSSVVMLHPAERLEPDTRYVVALRNLQGRGGGRVGTTAAFEALRDNLPTDPRVEALRSEYEDIFQFLGGQGVLRDELDLAWAFHTASTESLTGMLTYAVETALDNFDPDTATWRVTNVNNNANGGLLYSCKLTVPSFLTGLKVFDLDSRHLPVLQGTAEADFVVYVPATALQAANKPVPVALYGHSIFSSAYEVQNVHMENLGYAGVAVNLKGITAGDVLDLSLVVLPAPISYFHLMTDQLIQSIANAILVDKLLPRVAERLERDRGGPILDPDKVVFIGESFGGIIGGSLMGVAPDIEAGALLVPGGGWSHTLPKSEIYRRDMIGGISIESIVNGLFPDPLERAVIFTLLQPIFDPVDSVTFARHWSREPLGNLAPRHVLIQIGLQDDTVPPFSAEMLARPAGLPLVEPVPKHTVGIPEVPAPTDGAYFGGMAQYPNRGHNAARDPRAFEQKRTFFYSFFDLNGTYGLPGNIE
jgi:hypothetical protein